MRKRTNNEDGFTLVEMLAVLVIVAVLAAVAVPSMKGFVEKAKRDSYIAEARIVCTAVQQYLLEEEIDGIVPDDKLYEDIARYDIGDKRNVLTSVLEGSITKKGRIVNIMFLYDKFDGIEYNIDGYIVSIELNHEVIVEKEDKYFGK
ncbi:type II secretion system protein [Clostridium sp. chh4-2]|uniref:prepilin-type N-terminal cleavage/methylation domain-containing protein n=1 Tax=Clostridium sp. chh4-2 TaxID=2067550 RepID=UPI000CCEC714|nr:prepilin-type N-terminal cleavage/methylation domain-containing protein [Clostridium sp. chh4-2]PNV61834.1 type II secretion system protein [Clostridium sp. chh4-2]